MKIFLTAFLCFYYANLTNAQKPKDGIYTYSIVFAEWNNKSLGATCTVVIKGDSITLIHNGKGDLSGYKGDIIEAGRIMKHKSGKWIIAHGPKDKNADEIGGCSGGPGVIDFKRKRVMSC